MECGVWLDYVVLVEQGQMFGGFQDLLDYEYYIGMVGIVFVKDECYIVLIGLWQNVVFEFGDLFVVFDDDCIFVDQIDL